MDNLVSVPVTNPCTFLKQRAKASLTQDMDKAADLTAQRNEINPDIPDGLAQLQQLNRQVRTWTKKARDPFGSDTEENISPTQNMIKALIKTIKSPEDSTRHSQTSSHQTRGLKERRGPRVVGFLKHASQTSSTARWQVGSTKNVAKDGD